MAPSSQRPTGAVLAKVSNEALGQLLVERGFITPEQCERALTYAREHGVRLGEALLALEFITPSLLSSALAEQFGTIPMVLEPAMIDLDLVRRFPIEFLRRHKLLPLLEIESQLIVAVGDPNATAGLEELAALAPDKELVVQLADAFQIEKVLGSVEASMQAETVRASHPAASPVSVAGQDDELFSWIVAAVFADCRADVIIRLTQHTAYVLREANELGRPRLPLKTFAPDIGTQLIESLRARARWIGSPPDDVAILDLPADHAHSDYLVQLALLRDTNGVLVRLRAIAKHPPQPMPDDIAAASALRGPLTLVRYESVARLEQFFAALCSANAGEGIVLFTDVVRCSYPRSIHFSSLASDPTGLARRACASVVAFDTLCSRETIERLRAQQVPPPRLIVAVPEGDAVMLPAWLAELVQTRCVGVVRVAASGCELVVQPTPTRPLPESSEDARWI